eukprot:15343888-Alexandrium_andersonii.AAC.1
MSASLVGSEMCIRDRDGWTDRRMDGRTGGRADGQADRKTGRQADKQTGSCLLYTSDAADDM